MSKRGRAPASSEPSNAVNDDGWSEVKKRPHGSHGGIASSSTVQASVDDRELESPTPPRNFKNLKKVDEIDIPISSGGPVLSKHQKKKLRKAALGKLSPPPPS
ncbi:hypothetical protein ACET3Z_001685 [Daucus carota]